MSYLSERVVHTTEQVQFDIFGPKGRQLDHGACHLVKKPDDQWGYQDTMS